MATLDEVSIRLMKPAKDLADWSFPLATILEDYYTLLNAQDDVNFSNAALVLQNSANVYVRRVEYLYHESNSLNQTSAENETAEITTKDAKNCAKSKHKLIDLGDFERMDFTKFVGKNNNLKARNETNNSAKLLSERFPQLENVSRTSLPIEVYDIHGEVVGKKYDFRCNEYLTASGMLVRHLTPKDIERSLCEDNCEDLRMVHEKDTDLFDTSFKLSIDSGLGSSIQCSNIRTISSLSISAENNWEPSLSRPESSLSITEPITSTVGESLTLDSLPDNTISEINSQHTEKRGSDAMQDDYGLVDYHSANEREDSADCTPGSDPQACCTFKTTPEPVVPDIRRSKKLKNVIDAVNDLNPKTWEAIPFNGVPDELPKNNRSEFKLPCPISLLKFREKSRKRKCSSEIRRRRCLERLSMIEAGTAQKKITMYSPTSQLFLPLKKEKLEDFDTCFEEHMKNLSNIDGIRYEPVTDFSMDLLGFRTQFGKDDRENIPPVESDFPENVENSDPTVRGIVSSISEPMENIVDDFPMPETPESSDSSSETETPTSARLSSQRCRIEQSVRAIYDCADVRTAQEEAVARWHEFMKPKLREAERRPPFDISQYSARLMETIKAKNNHKIEFKEIVNDREPTEVARYFLASLQLANKYNVEIDTSRNGEGNFTLVLLDNDRSDNIV